MKSRDKKRITAALVLLLAIMPVFVLKTVHVHDHSAGSALHEGGSMASQQLVKQCPICSFVFSPFTGCDAVTADEEVVVCPCALPYMEGGVVVCPVVAYGLRAPPSLSRGMDTLMG